MLLSSVHPQLSGVTHSSPLVRLPPGHTHPSSGTAGSGRVQTVALRSAQECPQGDIASVYTRSAPQSTAEKNYRDRKGCSGEHVSSRQQCIISKIVSQTKVQWKGLTLEEPFISSRYPLYQKSMLKGNNDVIAFVRQ